MNRPDQKPPSLASAPRSLGDDELRAALGGLSAMTTLELPVHYRTTGPGLVTRMTLPAGVFGTGGHGWGGHH